jgi:glycine betaine/proline transport system permease protein
VATYDFVFDWLGLRGWCGEASTDADAPMSMEDLLASGGGEAPTPTIWELPFPSMDALHDACAAFPQSRELTAGLERGFLNVKDVLSYVLDPITQPLSWALDGALYGILNTPWWIVIPLLLLITWAVSRSWSLLAFVGLSIGGLAFIDHYDVRHADARDHLRLYRPSVCVLLGVPIGIAMSRSDRMQRDIIPVLDMLQTLPTFVYLIPLIFLFSRDRAEALRHRHHPLCHRAGDPADRPRHPLVDKDVIEAADAFGMTAGRSSGVQIPLALPNIMAGVNQTIMMSLAMVVIASLVSAPGLGVLVLRGIRNLELGVGLVAGLGIVLLASSSTASPRRRWRASTRQQKR